MMPWVKLYGEFIDDPKIGALSETAKLRFVQLILLAGECDADGILAAGDEPMTIEMIAWRLRISADQLAADIAALEKGGMLRRQDGVIELVNFDKRQGRGQTDKRQEWRERKARSRMSRECHTDVTRDTSVTPVTDVTPVTLLEGERDKDKEGDKEGEGDSPRAPDTALSLYLEAFADELRGSKPNAEQIALLAGVTDLTRWRAVLKLWKEYKYECRKVPNLIDRYNKHGQAPRPIAAPNWPRKSGMRQQVSDATDAEREAAREAARKRIEERAKRKAGEA